MKAPMTVRVTSTGKVEHLGQTQSIQPPAPAAAPAALPEPYKVHNGYTRLTADGGTQEVQRATFQYRPPEFKGSVSATMSEVSGRPTVVLPNGMRTTLAAAVTMGYLTEVSPGHYRDTAKGQAR